MAKVAGTGNTNKKAVTAAKAVAANAKPERAASAATPANAVVTIKATAISKGVGLKVIEGMNGVSADEAKLHELTQSIKSKRYDLMSAATMAIIKAAQADNSIDLSVAFGGDPKMMGRLNDQLGLAMGFRAVRTFDTPNGEVKRMVYAKEVAAYFPQSGDKKGDEATQRKSTFRSNFSHLLKKCAQAASAIIADKVVAKEDKKTGTLLLSGPAIKKQFGAEEVLLDEKQTVGTGKDAVKLKEKPSFTAMAAKAAKAHGAVIRQGAGNHRGQKATSNKPEDVFKALVDPLIQAIGKLKVGEISDKVVEILDSLASAISAKIDA